MEMLEYGNPDAGTVLIQMVDGHDLGLLEKEIALIREKTDTDFLMRAFRVRSWNTDLSPWEAPAVFGNEGFGGGAEKTLSEVLASCKDAEKIYYLGGYSLAGLFALWSAGRTDQFRGVAAASPSVWFPGFTEYLKEQEIRCERVYLSLGDKEAKTRNPVMSTVAERIEETYELMRSRNVESVLEWNEGNHFKEPEIRTAKAFAWLLTKNP